MSTLYVACLLCCNLPDFVWHLDATRAPNLPEVFTSSTFSSSCQPILEWKMARKRKRNITPPAEVAGQQVRLYAPLREKSQNNNICLSSAGKRDKGLQTTPTASYRHHSMPIRCYRVLRERLRFDPPATANVDYAISSMQILGQDDHTSSKDPCFTH